MVETRPIPSFNLLKSLSLIRKHVAFIPALGDDVRDQHGGVIYANFNQKVYYITDPDLADHIFRLDYRQAIKSKIYDELRPFQGNGPVVSSGEAWTNQRRLTSQSFTRQHLSRMVPTMNAEVQKMLARLRKPAATGQELNIVPELNDTTFRVLCAAILGQELSAYQTTVYREINDGIYLFQKRVFSLLRFPMWIPTPLNRAYANGAKRYRGAIQEIMDRAESDENTPGMLAHLIRQKGRKDEGVLDILATMIAAGFETTANALSWTLIHLGNNPEVQEKLYREIVATLGDRPFDATTIDQIPYAVWVIKEALRINPPVWLPERLCKEAVRYNGWDIPAGSTVSINLWSIGRHPDYWERPTEFIPERFSPERLTERQEKAFVAFASGPRECQGKQFAMIELQMILINLIREFRFELAKDYRPDPEVALVLRPKGGLRVRVVARDSVRAPQPVVH